MMTKEELLIDAVKKGMAFLAVIPPETELNLEQAKKLIEWRNASQLALEKNLQKSQKNS